MELKKTLIQFSNITRGRIAPTQVFSNYLAYCALLLSSRTDPVHHKRRLEKLESLKEAYNDVEWRAFHKTMTEMCAVVVNNAKIGAFNDLFAETYMELGGGSTALKQNFTSESIAKLLSTLAIQSNIALPECGYFTTSDHTCGSGTLLLSSAERIQECGFNPSVHIVMQAADLDIQCVYMTYLNLSLYGIPAVIVHGNTLTLEEYDRWYTPVYLLNRWVWKEPMLFGHGGYASNEMLKMLDEPMYRAIRRVERLLVPPHKGDADD